MSDTPPSFPVIRGRTIRMDEDGMVCLNDIHAASGKGVHHTPAQWQRLQMVSDLMVAIYERNVGAAHKSAKISMRSVIYARRGTGGGTFADRRLALSYAEYLSPKLALEVREVFLRFMDADPVLADDILDRATPEANEWAGTRALGRTVRHQFTETLKSHGAERKDYGMCTNALYSALFDKNASQLKVAKGLPKAAKLRDSMSTKELVFVMAGETLSSERIEEENSQGGEQCRKATSKSARFIREAIDADRRDRQSKLI